MIGIATVSSFQRTGHLKNAVVHAGDRGLLSSGTIADSKWLKLVRMRIDPHGTMAFSNLAKLTGLYLISPIATSLLASVRRGPLLEVVLRLNEKHSLATRKSGIVGARPSPLGGPIPNNTGMWFQAVHDLEFL